MADIFDQKEQKPPAGVEDDLRFSYRAVFLGNGTKADGRRVLCDLIDQTHLFKAFMSEGVSAEVGEAKREIGLYILAILGLAPSHAENTLDSMDTLVRLFAANKRASEKAARGETDDT